MSEQDATQKAPAKKTAVKKAPVKKSPAKRPVTEKAPAKKTAAKKTATKKAAAKKTPVKKTAAKKVAKRAPAQPITAERISGAARQHQYRTLEERIARGLAWRETAPLDSLDVFEPAADRPSALSMLRAEDTDRLSDLVPLRWGRMSTSAFAFYRGSASVMAYDLAQHPRTGGRTQLCGDAHLSNFGLFGSPERDLVFDVNDFDETLPGPFEWDLKRLAASAILAARDRGFKKKQARAAAVAACETYRSVIQRLATAGTLDVWYVKVDASLIEEQAMAMAKEIDPKEVKTYQKRIDQIFSQGSQ